MLTMKIRVIFSVAVIGTFVLPYSQAWIPQSQKRLFIVRSSSSGASVSLSSSTSINNNIVLQPSADESAFDSFKIGGARVHRYSSRDQDPADSQTEYVMWYHGRTQEMGADPSLPPLSTGRIGRATSRNGLHWIKDEIGSASEDRPDVSLGLNTEAWWGFDTAHVGLGNVLLPMSTPAVMTEGGVYLMYFMGGNKEETLIADYMDKAVPESMQNAKIQGMRMKIGVAVSQDGITWGRVEGDDPSGAILSPWDKADPNQQSAYASAGGFDEELYCAWPDVVTNIGGSKESSFLMYYSTMTKKDKKKCIAYAVSGDGFRWTRKGICLKPDEDTMDAGGCARCSVIRDALFDQEKGTWVEQNTWTMYYEGVSLSDNKHRILAAKSRDGGKTWTKTGLALDVGANDDAWDFGGVGSPHVIRYVLNSDCVPGLNVNSSLTCFWARMDDGAVRMYYTGQDVGGKTAIGVAKLSNDEGPSHWVREQATISFANSDKC